MEGMVFTVLRGRNHEQEDELIGRASVLREISLDEGRAWRYGRGGACAAPALRQRSSRISLRNSSVATVRD
jgi:hypothetical protein